MFSLLFSTQLDRLCQRLSEEDLLSCFTKELQRAPAQQQSTADSADSNSISSSSGSSGTTSAIDASFLSSARSLGEGLLSGSLARADAMVHLRALLNAPGAPPASDSNEVLAQTLFNAMAAAELPSSSSSSSTGSSSGRRSRAVAAVVNSSNSSSASISSTSSSGTTAGVSAAAQQLQQRLCADSLSHIMQTLLARVGTVNTIRSSSICSKCSTAELQLLLALQHKLCSVLTELTASGSGSTRKGPVLDPRRMSEGLSLKDGGSTVTQRSHKSWGSALAAEGYAPNTGKHQWTVHLDKCEKGHVFLGKASSYLSCVA
jgi:trimeric autotransporter adhesin